MKKILGTLAVFFFGTALLGLSAFTAYQSNTPLTPPITPKAQGPTPKAQSPKPKAQPEPDPATQLLGDWRLVRFESQNNPEMDKLFEQMRDKFEMELRFTKEHVRMSIRQGQQLTQAVPQNTDIPYRITSIKDGRIEAHFTPQEQTPSDLSLVLQNDELRFVIPNQPFSLVFRRASSIL